MADMRGVDSVLAAQIYHTEFTAKSIRFDMPVGVDYRLLDISVSVRDHRRAGRVERALGRTITRYDDAMVVAVNAVEPVALAKRLGLSEVARLQEGARAIGRPTATAGPTATTRCSPRVTADRGRKSSDTDTRTGARAASRKGHPDVIMASCKSLETLLAQVNAYAPHRRKDSDSSIGDARHQAEASSDHNPTFTSRAWASYARAIYPRAETGFDAYAFAEMLRQQGTRFIRYIISNKKIAGGKDGPSPWQWRKYTGSSPHDHHTHVSVSEAPSCSMTRARLEFRGHGRACRGARA